MILIDSCFLHSICHCPCCIPLLIFGPNLMFFARKSVNWVRTWYFLNNGWNVFSKLFLYLFCSNLGAVSVRRSLNTKLPIKCSSRQVHMENNHIIDSRGALIVLEGLDRSGKTSQSSRLVSYVEGLGHSVESWRFPDRNTGVGQMISSYLGNKSQLDDHAIHLLFSANRWEKRFVSLY